jgi:hypothetical protein
LLISGSGQANILQYANVTGVTTANGTLNLDGNLLGGLVVNSGVTTINAAGSAVSTVNSNGGQILNNGSLAGLTVNSDGNVTNNAVVNGAVTVNNGTLTLASGSTQTGNFAISGGTVSANSAFGGGQVSITGGTLTVQSGGTANGSTSVTNAVLDNYGIVLGALQVNTGSTVTIFNAANVTGATSQTNGVLNVLSGGRLGNTLITSGGITNLNSGSTVQGTANITTGGTLNGNGTFLSDLYVTGGNATLTGSTINGNTFVTGGTLGTASSPAIVFSGTLNSTGGTTTLNNSTVAGLTTVSGGTLILASSSSFLNSGLNLTSGSVSSTAGTITTTGDQSVITTSGGTLALRGTTILGSAGSTANTPTIQINAGTVSVDLGNASQSGTNNLTLGGFSNYLIFNNSTLPVSAIGNLMAGVDTADALLIDLYATADKIIDGVDVANFGVVYFKANTIYVSVASFVPGLTSSPSIQRGVDAASFSDTIWVEGGATTFTGGLSITDGKNLNVFTGDSDTSTINTQVSGDWSLSEGSSIHLNLTNTTYSNYTISSANSVALNNATLNLANLSDLTIGATYTILDLPAGASLTGSFANSTFNFGTSRGVLNYSGGVDSNDVLLTIIPATDPTNVLVNTSFSGYQPGQIATYNGTNYYYGYDAFANLSGGFGGVASNSTLFLFNGTYSGATATKTFALEVPAGQSASVTSTIDSSVAMNFTGWSGSLLASQINVSAGSTFNNLASFISDNGTLQFAGGSTFTNVSLTATSNITITASNSSGATLEGVNNTPVITSTNTAANLSLANLILSSNSESGVGVSSGNTNSVTFTNVSMGENISTAGSISNTGPMEINFNYPESTSVNVLAVYPTFLTFTQFGNGASNLTLAGTSSLTINTVFGNATSAGNNAFTLGSNTSLAGGNITTGLGNDTFTLNSYFPGTLNGGAGTNNLTLSGASAGAAIFNAGGLGTVFAPTNNTNNFTITSLGLGTLNTTSLTRPIFFTSLTSFTGVSGLKGGDQADNFIFENGGRITGAIDGSKGNDTLSLANYSSSSTLRTNITGSDIGSIDLMQPGNLVGNVSVVGSYSKIENLIGGAGTDIFHFNNGGAVSGTLDGGLGNNTLDYRDYSIAGLNVNLETKAATLVGGGASGRINRIRDIFGTSNNDNLVGDSQPNIIYGGAGNDNIVGGDGNDLIIGGTGRDTVSGGTGYNVVIGGYVDFNLGGGGNSNTSYEISVSNWDYVLRSMMDQLSTVVDGTTADLSYALMENTGVSVSIPGVSGSKNVQLIASTTGNTTLRGTVFDDGMRDRVDVGGDNQGWLFYSDLPVSTADITIKKDKARRRTVANRLIP